MFLYNYIKHFTGILLCNKTKREKNKYDVQAIFNFLFAYLGHLEPELVCGDGGEGFSGPGEVVVGQVVV